MPKTEAMRSLAIELSARLHWRAASVGGEELLKQRVHKRVLNHNEIALSRPNRQIVLCRPPPRFLRTDEKVRIDFGYTGPCW